MKRSDYRCLKKLKTFFLSEAKLLPGYNEISNVSRMLKATCEIIRFCQPCSECRLNISWDETDQLCAKNIYKDNEGPAMA